MDRRHFLKSIAAALAASAVPPALASIGQPAQIDKYERALELYDDCLQANTLGKAEVSKKFRVLAQHFQDHFLSPENTAESRKAVQALLKLPDEELVRQVRTLPPVIAEEMFVIAIVKMALTVDQLNINLYFNESKWFFNVYGPVIIAATMKY